MVLETRQTKPKKDHSQVSSWKRCIFVFWIRGVLVGEPRRIHKNLWLSWKRGIFCEFSLFFQKEKNMPLVAPYCAIPRDYLSDTPLLRAMGFLVSQHGQLGAIPPSPFSERFPFGEHAKWRFDTPLHKVVSQQYLHYTLWKRGKTRTKPPSAIVSRKGIAATLGVSRIGPLRTCQVQKRTPFSRTDLRIVLSWFAWAGSKSSRTCLVRKRLLPH